jgi:hypothetical protein
VGFDATSAAGVSAAGRAGMVRPASRSPLPVALMAIGGALLVVGVCLAFLTEDPTLDQSWAIRVLVSLGGGLVMLGLGLGRR